MDVRGLAWGRTTGRPHGEPGPGRARRPAPAREDPRVHPGRPRDPRPGDRRQHRALQRGARGPAAGRCRSRSRTASTGCGRGTPPPTATPSSSRSSATTATRTGPWRPWPASRTGARTSPATGPRSGSPGLRVSGNFFDLLGAPAAVGRTLRAGGRHPGQREGGGAVPRPVAAALRRATPRVVGSRLILNGEPFTVVGVLARGASSSPSATSSSPYPSPRTRTPGARTASPRTSSGSSGARAAGREPRPDRRRLRRDRRAPAEGVPEELRAARRASWPCPTTRS